MRSAGPALLENKRAGSQEAAVTSPQPRPRFLLVCARVFSYSLCVDVCVRKSQRGEESVSMLYCKMEWLHDVMFS